MKLWTRTWSRLALAGAFGFVALLGPVSQTSAADTLTIGSVAPELDIEHWVQNGDGRFKPVTKFAKDKVYVVEFWATWCGPCLLEMPNSQKLANEFIPREVEFIYLSVDTDKDKWNKKLATLPKGKNVHHYLISPESDLAKEFEIPPIPRYMLIGKDGRLISNDAPRPQSKEARELILESLIKK
jgi:thiol-disulfide isomerase/thioredoxin